MSHPGHGCAIWKTRPKPEINTPAAVGQVIYNPILRILKASELIEMVAELDPMQRLGPSHAKIGTIPCKDWDHPGQISGP
ncbi:MAG: hypothetical protein WCK35_05750 [Chloroflexota bacterium]